MRRERFIEMASRRTISSRVCSRGSPAILNESPVTLRTIVFEARATEPASMQEMEWVCFATVYFLSSLRASATPPAPRPPTMPASSRNDPTALAPLLMMRFVPLLRSRARTRSSSTGLI